MPDYRKVRAFEPSMRLSVDVHVLARRLPARLFPGAPSQLCRAASSVPANIVEGASRATQLEFARFLVIARASAAELTVHLRLVAELDPPLAPTARELESRARHVASMLASLIARIHENEARKENETRRTRRTRRS
jgi:four helix bundle protein